MLTRIAAAAIAATSVVASIGAAGSESVQPSESGAARLVSAEPWIVVTTDVHAPIAEVWNAWTTDDGVRSFFADNSNVRLEIGGPFEIYFSMEPPAGSRGSEGCTILSYLPERMLSFSWNAPPKFGEHFRFDHTWVVVEFESLTPDSTRVRLSHLGWEQKKAAQPEHAQTWDQIREYFSSAWPYVLSNLKRRFDEGITRDEDPARKPAK